MSLARQLRSWAGGIGLWRKIAIALAAAALASGIATYLALTGAPPIGPRPGVVLALLYLDLVLLLALAAVVAQRLVAVWAERRRGLAGSRLQIRLVGLFGPAKGVPARTATLIGRQGVVTQDIDRTTGTGRVNVGGEDWAARSNEPIAAGAKVRVVGADGIVLEVTAWTQA